MKANPPLTEQVRKAIKTCGRSRYSIAKETGIRPETISRFFNGERGLSMEALDAIGQCLGLTIIMAEKGRKQHGKHSQAGRRPAADNILSRRKTKEH
jgi:hypothetical protein